MTMLLVSLFILLSAAYVVALAMAPVRTTHSLFELKRRGDSQSIRRENQLEVIEAILRFIQMLFVLLIGSIGVMAWQWFGVLAALFVVVIANMLARVRPISRFAAKRYQSLEPTLLDYVGQWPILKTLFVIRHHELRDQKLESPEQLLNMIGTTHVLDDDQKTIIKNGVKWHKIAVSMVMTKRGDIIGIKHSELLGPLVLDDLHKSGHNRFPVTKGGLDSIIGILDITELLEVDSGKTSQTAERAMAPQPLRIEEDATLPEALAMLQKSRQHLLVVIDGDGKTVGIITLADITGSLLGRS